VLDLDEDRALVLGGPQNDAGVDARDIDGMITFSPGMWQNKVSVLSEWCSGA